MDWQDYLTEENLCWLLEDDNPSVRYFTLIDLLDRSADDPEVTKAKKLIMKEGPVAEILSCQSSDGGFVTPDMIQQHGERTARSGYLPKYTNTIWQAIFLAQLGADTEDERVKRLGRFILENNYSSERRVVGIEFEWAGRHKYLDMPCFIANMVWSLSKLGFYEDKRVQDSIKWIVKYQRFDDGDFKTPSEWPYQGSRDRCFGRHSCYIGCTQALKAMTVVPEKDRTPEFKDLIKRGIEFVLLHRVYKQSRGRSSREYRSRSAGTRIGKGEPIRKDYLLLTFPLTYYDDVLQILDTLLFFKVKNQAIEDGLEFVLSKRGTDNRWPLEKIIRRSALHAKFEGKSRESKWSTYRALNVLKKYNEVLSEQKII